MSATYNIYTRKTGRNMMGKKATLWSEEWVAWGDGGRTNVIVWPLLSRGGCIIAEPANPGLITAPSAPVNGQNPSGSPLTNFYYGPTQLLVDFSIFPVRDSLTLQVWNSYPHRGWIRIRPLFRDRIFGGCSLHTLRKKFHVISAAPLSRELSWIKL